MSSLLLVAAVATVAVASAANEEQYRSAAEEEVEQSISGPQQVRKLLQGARRLADDDNGGGYNAEGLTEVEDELMNYSLKLLKCQGEEALSYDGDGNKQYGVAIVRACPRSSCSDNTQGGCKKGHADFAVPLTDFVAAYMQDQADNNRWDDNLANYAQCSQYVPADGNNKYSYYIGPACTRDGKNVKLEVFKDAYCQTKADKKFEDISNGQSLPYSSNSGGLVSKSCMSCGENYGDGNGLQLKEMCAELYEDAALKCEEWAISHYYYDSITEVYRFGKDRTGCKRIGWMDKSPEPFTEWASIFALLLLVAGSVAGAVWYTNWWKERKYTSSRMT